jgi:tetratricopeptide (TPR) repeat protein
MRYDNIKTDNIKEEKSKEISQKGGILARISGYFENLVGGALLSLKKLRNLEKTNYELGLYHLKEKNYFDAAMRFKLVLLLNKNNIEAMTALSDTYIKQGYYKKALRSLQNILDNNPDNEKALALLKLAQVKMGNYNKSEITG